MRCQQQLTSIFLNLTFLRPSLFVWSILITSSKFYPEQTKFWSVFLQVIICIKSISRPFRLSWKIYKSLYSIVTQELRVCVHSLHKGIYRLLKIKIRNDLYTSWKVDVSRPLVFSKIMINTLFFLFRKQIKPREERNTLRRCFIGSFKI